MKNELSNIDVVLRNSWHPFRPHGPCLVRIEAQPNSRAVNTAANAVRVAFVAAELQILSNSMNRAYPSLKTDWRIGRDPNGDYVPGKQGIPYLVALAAIDGTVKIGIELTNGVRHPVVELTPKAGSNVRRSGVTVTWMPTWTQYRVLCAEFSAPPQCVQQRVAFFKTTRKSFKRSR